MAQPLFETTHLYAVPEERPEQLDMLAKQRALHEAIGTLASNYFRIYAEVVVRSNGLAVIEDFPEDPNAMVARPHFGLSSPHHI